MSAGEVEIVVELCARLTRAGSLTGRFISSDIYRHHAVPGRVPAPPVQPDLLAGRRNAIGYRPAGLDR